MKLSIPLFVSLMGLDVLLTLGALESGLAQEGNPLGQFYYDIGPWFMGVVKLAAVLIIMTACYYLRHYRPARVWLAGANIVMALIVANNVFLILRASTGG